MNHNKVKLFLFLTIVLLIGLIVLNVFLLISIHSKNNQLAEQQSIISQQEQTLNYYQNK